MAIQLFQFIYSTARQAANDPQNATYWLPRTLRALRGPDGGPLLPLRQETWDLGAVTGEAGATFQQNLASEWWTLTGFQFRQAQDPRLQQMRAHRAVPCPERPWPTLAFSGVSVSGLENVSLPPTPAAVQNAVGYTATLTLRFGAYDVDGLGPVAIRARYDLTQCVCSAAAPTGTACDGFVPPATISGGGDITLHLTDFWVDADVAVAVAGSGAARTVEVRVGRLTARGAGDSRPAIDVDTLTIDTPYQGVAGLWREAAIRAISSDVGRAALTQNLNAALNSPNFLGSVGRVVGPQLAKLLDANLGEVPAGALPEVPGAADNPVDAYLFDRVRVALNNPASTYYLPRVVLSSASPVLDPLDAGTLSLGPLAQDGIRLSSVTLSGLTVHGLSNVQAPADRLLSVPGGLQASLQVGVLDPPPTVTVSRGGSPASVRVPGPPLRITGTFACTLQGQTEPLTGTFGVTAAQAGVAALLSASGTTVDALEVRFPRLALEIPHRNLTIAVQIDSSFQFIVNAICNQDAFKQRILDAIGTQLAARRDDLGAAATSAVRSLIRSRLGAGGGNGGAPDLRGRRGAVPALPEADHRIPP